MDKNVRVYWNLHQGQWSIQDRQTGLVVGRQPELLLQVGKFNVRQSGRKRVLTEGRKNVHAFAEGWYPTIWVSPKFYHTKGDEVTYNPHKNDSFVYKESGKPITEANVIWLTTTAEGNPSVTTFMFE